MAGSSACDILFISVNHSITLMGKVWVIVMVLLRILVLIFAGYPLYQDEQDRFVCNTIQPGCANVCYDFFSPISLLRFWLVQLVTLSLPFTIFVIYVVHKVSNALTVELDTSGNSKASIKFPSNQLLLLGGQQGCFTGAYILQLLFRILLEAGFGAAHYYLFGFYIPRRFLCQYPPCTTQVDCYISRPTEKTIMLNFMQGVAALSLLLNILDFVCAIKRSVRQKNKKKRMAKGQFEEEEQCLVSAKGASRRTDPICSFGHSDMEPPPVQMGSFRRRRGSQGSSGGVMHNLAQELPSLDRSSPITTNLNNGCLFSHEECNGSELALCPQEVPGTPRSIRVSKRSRLKPPPPPRRDLSLPAVGSAAPVNVSTTTFCSKGVGTYTVVQTKDDGQEKRSEWV
ncbi:gap junction delta-4 protein-like [Gouania willdenowi]|uniref:Gap junction protein n=1 Tax=Gouania willdenowi TaxID=441366 RepID=A0A8C5GHB5_GOUWI|nr:gap junction delta-4 protein-like [Gouania willdenowi]XP_028290491.1 gap junction delta-4 protein-like [Gouania willdenowi]